MSKNANPYREGTEYHIGFAAIKANQIITRSALIVILTEAITAKRQAATEVPVHLAKRYDSLEAYQSQEAIDKSGSGCGDSSAFSSGNCRGSEWCEGRSKFFQSRVGVIVGVTHLRWVISTLSKL